MQVDGTTVKLQIWDTAGAERFRQITRCQSYQQALRLLQQATAEICCAAYYRGASGIFVVYDVTDTRSFLRVRSWMQEIETTRDDFCNKAGLRLLSNGQRLAHTAAWARLLLLQLLVGNKCDLEDRREVPYSKGQALAEELGIPFIETSAVADINITEVRGSLQRLCLRPVPCLPGLCLPVACREACLLQAFMAITKDILARPPSDFQEKPKLSLGQKAAPRRSSCC